MRKIAAILAIVGGFIVLGTAGAVDNEAISLEQMWIQLLIGGLFIIAGSLIAVVKDKLERR